jgi:hypothetical protein
LTPATTWSQLADLLGFFNHWSRVMLLQKLNTATIRWVPSIAILNYSALRAHAQKVQFIQFAVVAFIALTLLLLSPMALAGAGHDHGAADSKFSGSALPRFAAVSEEFELVGIVEGQRITLYLDRFADNTQVRNAQIEIEIAGNRYAAEKRGDDVYEINLKEELKYGLIAVTATINAGEVTDLLATELDMHKNDRGQMTRFSWKAVALWTGAALLALFALAAARRFRSSGQTI